MAQVDYPLRLDVDGETFLVHRRGPGDYDCDWISGPNRGYGFGSRTGVAYEPPGPPPGTITRPPEVTTCDHVESIRNFLAQIDPKTGHIDD